MSKCYQNIATYKKCLEIAQRILKCWQSGEISPNLVTPNGKRKSGENIFKFSLEIEIFEIGNREREKERERGFIEMVSSVRM